MSCHCYPPTPILYYDNISPQARSCYMLIKMLGIDVDLRPVSLSDGEHLDEAYQQINPSGTVPTFIDGKFVLYDSHTIMIYICDKFTCTCLPQLCPQQYTKRMQLLNILFYEGCVLYRRHSHALTDILLQKYPNVDIEYHKSKISDCYQTLDKLLEGHEFLIGNSISIADFSVVSTVGVLDIMFPINADLWPNLYKWMMSLKSLPWYSHNEDGIEKQKELLATVGDFPFPTPIVLNPSVPMMSSFQGNIQQKSNTEINESVKSLSKENIDDSKESQGDEAKSVGSSAKLAEVKQENCTCMQDMLNEIKQMLKLQSKQFENIMENNQLKRGLKKTSFSETDFNQRACKCLEDEYVSKRKPAMVMANYQSCDEICYNDDSKAKSGYCDRNTCSILNPKDECVSKRKPAMANYQSCDEICYNDDSKAKSGYCDRNTCSILNPRNEYECTRKPATSSANYQICNEICCSDNDKVRSGSCDRNTCSILNPRNEYESTRKPATSSANYQICNEICCNDDSKAKSGSCDRNTCSILNPRDECVCTRKPATSSANYQICNEICCNDNDKAKLDYCDRNTCSSLNRKPSPYEQQNLFSCNCTVNTPELKFYKSCTCFNTNAANWNSYRDENIFPDATCCDCYTNADEDDYQDDCMRQYSATCTCKIDDDDLNDYQRGDDIIIDNACYCDDWYNPADDRNNPLICQCRTEDDRCTGSTVPEEDVCFILLRKPNHSNANNDSDSCKCLSKESNAAAQKPSSTPYLEGIECAQKLIKLCLCDAAGETDDYEKECLWCMCNLIEKIAFKRNLPGEESTCCCCDSTKSSNAPNPKQNASTSEENTIKKEDIKKKDSKDSKAEAAKETTKSSVKRSKSLELPRKNKQPSPPETSQENKSKATKQQKAAKSARNPPTTQDVASKPSSDNLEDFSSNEKIPPGTKFCCCCKSKLDTKAEENSARGCACVRKTPNLEREDSNAEVNSKSKSTPTSAMKTKSAQQREDKNKTSLLRNVSSTEITKTKPGQSCIARCMERIQQSRTSINTKDNKTCQKRKVPNVCIKTVNKCICKRDSLKSSSSKNRLKAGSVDKAGQQSRKSFKNDLNKSQLQNAFESAAGSKLQNANKSLTNSTNEKPKANKNISQSPAGEALSASSKITTRYEKDMSEKYKTTVLPVSANANCLQSPSPSEGLPKANAKLFEPAMVWKCNKHLLNSIFNGTSTIIPADHSIFGKNGRNLAKHTSSKTSNCLYYRNTASKTKEINKKRTVKKATTTNDVISKSDNNLHRSLRSTKASPARSIKNRSTRRSTQNRSKSSNRETSKSPSSEYINSLQNMTVRLLQTHANDIPKRISFRTKIPVRIESYTNPCYRISTRKIQSARGREQNSEEGNFDLPDANDNENISKSISIGTITINSQSGGDLTNEVRTSPTSRLISNEAIYTQQEKSDKTSTKFKHGLAKHSPPTERTQALFVQALTTNSSNKPLSKLSKAKLYDKNRKAAARKANSASLRSNSITRKANVEKKCSKCKNLLHEWNSFCSVSKNVTDIASTPKKFSSKQKIVNTSPKDIKQRVQPFYFISKK